MSLLESRLEELINRAGVRIVETSQLKGDLNACYHAPSQTIIVQWNLDPVTRRCAIAHELGHAHYGHDCSTQRAEIEADDWAAKELLPISMVEPIAIECESSFPLMAAEIGVTPALLERWMRLYQAGRIPPERYDCLTY